MPATAATLARILVFNMACLTFVLVLGTGKAAAEAASGDADTIDATVGDLALRLTAPPGQRLGTTALESIYLLHNISGDDVQPLAVYLAPETARFFGSRGQTLPDQGLISTLIITERGLGSRQVDDRALRDVLVGELQQQRALQAFLARERFGSQALRVSLPEARLLTVEDFLILEANERLLPRSGRRISYCVEAFLALRNRPVLASSCLTKPEVSAQDMYLLETSVGAWARRLLGDNPSSRSIAPEPAGPAGYRPAAETELDSAAKSLVVVNLRSAAEHRRQDVLVASALLSAQLRPDLRIGFDESNARFARNVASACGGARDTALGYRCELIAYERRLQALEQCTAASFAPLLQAEVVEPVPGLLPKT